MEQQSPHKEVYRDKDFIFYIEISNDKPVVHLQILNFSHNVFKRIYKAVHELAKQYEGIYAYGEDDSTYKLMDMCDFINTKYMVVNSNNFTRRVLCLF